MKSLKIICKTDAGKKAVQQHMSEFHKARIKKLAFKKLVRQEVTSDNPYTFEITITNATYAGLVKPKHFKEEIVEVMLKNGAEEDKDYSIEVE